jgi:hypothetical protein
MIDPPGPLGRLPLDDERVDLALGADSEAARTNSPGLTDE